METTKPDETPEGFVAYRHDPASVGELAQLADKACEGVAHLLEVGIRVPQLAATWTPALDAAAVREVRDTFSYLLSSNDGGSGQPGAVLGPLDGSLLPRGLREADSEVQALWTALSDTVSHPIARARCADIVFTLRLAKNSRDSAEKAARAYLAALGGSMWHREQSLGLLRAWTLARSVGCTVLEAEIVSAMLVMAEDVVTRADDPCAAVPLLEALTAPGRKGTAQPASAQANALLDQALTTYTEPHVIADVAALIRKRSADDPARAENASRVEITAVLSEADKATEPLTILFHLAEAASTARRLGISDLEQLAVSRLQDGPPVEWQTAELAIDIPPIFINNFMRPYRYANNWREALSSWFHTTEAPSGNHASNEAAARKIVSETVFIRLARVTVYGDKNLPKKTISSDEEAYKHQLARNEQYYMGCYGELLARALDLTRARFGIPNQDDLETFIRGSGTHPALARALAQALRLYWVGEYAACVHLSAPKVEAAARALLLELNEPVYRTAVGDGTGQFPGLGVFLDHLVTNGLDPDWERFLRTFLLSDGANIRNFVAHGFMDDTDRHTAALTLRACAVLVLITSEDTVRRDSADVKAALAEPLRGKQRRLWWRRVADATQAAYLEFRR